MPALCWPRANWRKNKQPNFELEKPEALVDFPLSCPKREAPCPITLRLKGRESNQNHGDFDQNLERGLGSWAILKTNKDAFCLFPHPLPERRSLEGQISGGFVQFPPLPTASADGARGSTGNKLKTRTCASERPKLQCAAEEGAVFHRAGRASSGVA